MPTTDSETPGTPTISVSTMSSISIDLDRRAALLEIPGQSSRAQTFSTPKIRLSRRHI
ncbi:hypothetical protein LWF15_06225 [Kineosporia rhizophila]|uniref:hypothetical protein n=1 Tax=Kineosporia TaxID=49184 RepID=UPI000A3E2F09|nr:MULTISPECIES: hypothetical protein [Kineosporia]MCE0535099.1 hypothetical protein [Kineosporia rhizophila]GLY14616.1 hypothetical protein Kisp01_16310 [Kineosporia sp. NBRC 101677]